MDKGQQFSVKSSQVFFSVADQDMKDFLLSHIDESDEKPQSEIFQEIKIENDSRKESIIEQKEQKSIISRLEIEIDKHNLHFMPVYGEIFIMIFESFLIGERKKEKGKILVTNYRIAFFIKSKKKVDVPFGFISHTQFHDKKGELFIHLKYPQVWKFEFKEKNKTDQLKIFLQLYLKAESVRSSFAINYGSKCPESFKKAFFIPDVEFKRMGIPNEHLIKMENKQFEICPTYPEYLLIPIQVSDSKVRNIAKSWNSNRFPIAVYIYRSIQKAETLLWRSSYINFGKPNEMELERRYLKYLNKNGEKLMVFNAQTKNPQKMVDESEVNINCSVEHLGHESLETLKISYSMIVKSFLNSRTEFMKEVIASKWYDNVLHLLQSASKIANNILMQRNVLIRCHTGYDRSAQLSALVQLILEPYYRTFEGFGTLVEKEFNFLSHPFGSRLGSRSETQQQIPVFIQFLDCVSQLIHCNQMSFAFTHKFLSKLSNIMYTGLFGTFICDSRRQFIKYGLEEDTVPVWRQLESQLTRNAFYQQKQGILKIGQQISDIRVWKQHFWYLTTPMKDTYKIHPEAEDNEDYINIECLQITEANQRLKQQILSQKQQITQLQQQLEQLKK